MSIWQLSFGKFKRERSRVIYFLLHVVEMTKFLRSSFDDIHSLYTLIIDRKKRVDFLPPFSIFNIFPRRKHLDVYKKRLTFSTVEYFIYRLITSQPIYTQRLLVLLFGTFRVIASNSKQIGTGMSSEAIGVSVAPSFFQSCVSDGKTARMEDVLRYKVTIINPIDNPIYSDCQDRNGRTVELRVLPVGSNFSGKECGRTLFMLLFAFGVSFLVWK